MIGVTVALLPPKYNVEDMTTITMSTKENLLKVQKKILRCQRSENELKTEVGGSRMGGVGEEYHDVYRKQSRDKNNNEGSAS